MITNTNQKYLGLRGREGPSNPCSRPYRLAHVFSDKTTGLFVGSNIYRGFDLWSSGKEKGSVRESCSQGSSFQVVSPKRGGEEALEK